MYTYVFKGHLAFMLSTRTTNTFLLF